MNKKYMRLLPLLLSNIISPRVESTGHSAVQVTPAAANPGGGNPQPPSPGTTTVSSQLDVIKQNVKALLSIASAIFGITPQQISANAVLGTTIDSITDINIFNATIVPQVVNSVKAIANNALTVFKSHPGTDNQIVQSADKAIPILVSANDIASVSAFIINQLIPLQNQFQNYLLNKTKNSLFPGNNSSGLPVNQNKLLPGVPTPQVSPTNQNNIPVNPPINPVINPSNTVKQQVWELISGLTKNLPNLGKTALEQNISFLKNLLAQLQTIQGLSAAQQAQIVSLTSEVNKLTVMQVQKVLTTDQAVIALVQQIQQTTPDGKEVIDAVIQTLNQFIQQHGGAGNLIPNWNPKPPVNPVNPPAPNNDSSKFLGSMTIITSQAQLTALLKDAFAAGIKYVVFIAHQVSKDALDASTYFPYAKQAVDQIQQFLTQNKILSISIDTTQSDFYIQGGINGAIQSLPNPGISVYGPSSKQATDWYQYFPCIGISTTQAFQNYSNIKQIIGRPDIVQADGHQKTFVQLQSLLQQEIQQYMNNNK
jgi:hypothetical protein